MVLRSLPPAYHHRFPTHSEALHHNQQHPQVLIAAPGSEMQGGHIQHSPHQPGAIRYIHQPLAQPAMVHSPRYPYPPQHHPGSHIPPPPHVEYRHQPSMPPLQPIPNNQGRLHPGFSNPNQL